VRRPIKREDACRPVVLADGRTAFRCFYCKKDFCTISDVNRHMDFHEGVEKVTLNCQWHTVLKHLF